MIGMLFVLGSLMMQQFESIIVKSYGKKHGKGGMFFNAVVCLFAMLYFIATDEGGLEFKPALWKFGLINSVMYATGFYATYVAYKIGSFGLTKLVIAFGVIIPTFYGIIFLKEDTTVCTYLALILILISIFLINYQKKDGNSKEKISPKWLLYILLAVVANAIITIIGKKQVDVFVGNYKNEFLMISLAGASLILFVLALIFERDSLKSKIKPGFIYGSFAGIFNGINNFFLLMTYFYLPLSFTAPIRTGLGIVFGFSLSVFLYKEKFNARQIVSVFIGIAAVVIMNLKF